MDMIHSSEFKVEKNIKLSDFKSVTDLGSSNKELKKQLESVREDLGDFQNTL